MSDPVEELERAAADLESAEAAVAEVGEARLRRLADGHEEFTALLEEYEEPASGSGRETFQAYVEFEGKLEEFVEGLPEDLLQREAFESAEAVLDRRRLEARDFELAREELAEATELVERLRERRRALERYREVRRGVELTLRERSEELDSVEETLAFGEADLEAPIEELEGPIQAYNGAVESAFTEFRSEAPARRVMDWLETVRRYPLVDAVEPPPNLVEYLHDREAGTEPIPTLLEWTDYSRSKLGHYVDDPRRFQAAVGANRTLLERVDADPLRVGWPPPASESLRYRTRELVAVVDRFACEGVLEKLHAVRSLPRTAAYDRLRKAARASAGLSTADREALVSGELEAKREQLVEDRDRLAEALERLPKR